MTDRLFNALRQHASAMDSATGQPRWGTVTSVNPATYSAKVMLQPEGVPTGWLPILSQSAGPGWGLICPPTVGQQVLVIPDLGDDEHGVILGGTWSTIDLPPQPPALPGGGAAAVQPGDAELVHSTGSFLRVNADGSVFLNTAGALNATVGAALTATVTGDATLTVEGGALGVTAALTTFSGNVVVTGDISDRDGTHGTLNTLRADYDVHTHQVPDVEPGGSTITTTTPTPQD